MGKIFGYVVVQPLSNREDIIDCYYITVIPTILGSGIRLFEKTDHEIKLRLLKTQSYNGMMDLIYRVGSRICIYKREIRYKSFETNKKVMPK